jgi:hypothetical protein
VVLIHVASRIPKYSTPINLLHTFILFCCIRGIKGDLPTADSPVQIYSCLDKTQSGIHYLSSGQQKSNRSLITHLLCVCWYIEKNPCFIAF